MHETETDIQWDMVVCVFAGEEEVKAGEAMTYSGDADKSAKADSCEKAATTAASRRRL